jgi:hypothetical protein
MMESTMKTHIHEKTAQPKMAACLALAVLAFCSVNQAFADPATVEANAIWAHDRLYGTVATDTNFKSPPPQSTDKIYAFPGQASVAEAAPGDRDYNGGRWDVLVVSYTDDGLALFDANLDGMVDASEMQFTNAEDILLAEQMGLLTITSANFYFECPLRPSHS